jgi:hypothetical protein
MSESATLSPCITRRLAAQRSEQASQPLVSAGSLPAVLANALRYLSSHRSSKRQLL